MDKNASKHNKQAGSEPSTGFSRPLRGLTDKPEHCIATISRTTQDILSFNSTDGYNSSSSKCKLESFALQISHINFLKPLLNLWIPRVSW